MVTRHFPLWLMLGLCCQPAPGLCGVIRGTLQVPSLPTEAEAKRTLETTKSHALPRPDPVLRGALGDAVVYIEHVPSDVDSALGAADTMPATLAQIDRAFAPRVLAIAAGDSVDLPNFDPVYHNVFSLSPIKNFDLGRYPKGQSRRVVFDRPGLVNVYCGIHSDMAAFVLVLPHHVFTRPDRDGAFALPPLPAGRYTLCIWHPDLRGLRREVTIPDDGDVVLELTL